MKKDPLFICLADNTIAFKIFPLSNTIYINICKYATVIKQYGGEVSLTIFVTVNHESRV